MAKVFTITEGLQNLGALRTGGQGSVYKGVRIGEIITAVKLLPTPIFNESKEDKNFKDFQNEVEKLKTVNRKPNPNVVKILGSGLTETGNFPFIEMEFIEGPDLEELLKPPHDLVFTIKEVVKVAEHLSNALAHCHSHDVKHGDIKSNNVKFNIKTGNYVLLDFGLAVMNDEQRRTSLRHAGAVEFMAPEQNEGITLFQTDIYSFGVVLFEMLAGQVPFTLNDKSETARNAVRLAHMETKVPDLIALRKERMPAAWSQEKRNREANVPVWLVDMVYKCLKKQPRERFATGVELHDFVVYNSTHVQVHPTQQNFGKRINEVQTVEESPLMQEITAYRNQVNDKEKELYKWTAIVEEKERELQQLQEKETHVAEEGGTGNVSKFSFVVMLLLAITVSAISAVYFISGNKGRDENVSRTEKSANNTRLVSDNSGSSRKSRTMDTVKQSTKKVVAKKPSEDAKKEDKEKPGVKETEEEVKDSYVNPESSAATKPSVNKTSGKKFGVVDKAYFHNSPDESTRRNAYIVHWNNAVLTPVDEKEGFIYVVYTNEKGQTSKGWLRKKDLKVID